MPQIPQPTLAFHVPSRSHPGTMHLVLINPATGFESCPCERFLYRKECRHLEEVYAGTYGDGTPVNAPSPAAAQVAARHGRLALSIEPDPNLDL